MATRCVGKDGGFVRASTTNNTSIDENVASTSMLAADQELNEDEQDEISESSSSSEDEASDYEVEKVEGMDGNSNDDNSGLVESSEGENVSDVEGGVDQQVSLRVGKVFKNVKHFREVLQDYEVQEGFHTLKQRNEKARVTAICDEKGCSWRIHASPIEDGITFMIKSLNPHHSCTRFGTNKKVNATWIARKLDPNLKYDTDMSINVMKSHLKEKYNVEVQTMQLYRARWIAKQENEGSHSKSYAKLEAYGTVLKQRNPGTAFVIEYQNAEIYRVEVNGVVTVIPQFKRMFVCFDACKQGFLKGCRPFIGLDGCHLKGIYGGVLVSAMSVDENNGIFPIAYSVVESKGKDSWLFFLHHLRESIQITIDTTTSRPFTFMTDKQKGLIEAISIIFPEVNHRHCSRHLYNNLKSQFGGESGLRTLFWAASKAYSLHKFNMAMNEMKIVNQETYDWLMKNPVKMWARHAFDHCMKSNHITNNMTESFNQWIGVLRSKPILTLIDQVRLKLMGRLQKRYEKSCNYQDILNPRIEEKLNKLQKNVRYCMPTYSGEDEFEVQDGSTSYPIYLSRFRLVSSDAQGLLEVAGEYCEECLNSIVGRCVVVIATQKLTKYIHLLIPSNCWEFSFKASLQSNIGFDTKQGITYGEFKLELFGFYNAEWLFLFLLVFAEIVEQVIVTGLDMLFR
ncbi:uncharacterized protein LOC122668481 [Telopea speciosissima]|uniref:uncharacterized protein LOC122668481 n=1 Tax=Telopea speciosissima TaxID=54955 RepID=UPI001CC4DCDF|nr:uncharacterized protein LOC122668481 [Telopea speciosissima]